MSEIIIACEMLRDELELAMTRTGVHPAIIWMEKGLHDVPQQLRETLQAEINRQALTHDTILLSMCYCGGALDGVCSETATIIVPRFDDCIRMLLSMESGQRNAADCRTMYFTRQWLSSDRFIGRDFEMHSKKYGVKRATQIYRAMLAHYREIRLIDTQAYPLAEYEEPARASAAQFNLEYGVQPGSIRILEKLLRHEFDAEFQISQPGQKFRQVDFLDMS